MVTLTGSGWHTFSIYRPLAGTIELLGDFTSWERGPIRMERGADGFWRASVKLPPGEHRFAYRLNGAGYLPDYAAFGVERKRSGEWVSLVRVGEDAEDGEVGGEAGPGVGVEAGRAAA